MLKDWPIHRFNQQVALTPEEALRVRELGEPTVRHPRGAMIRADGTVPDCVYLLLEGWATASVTLPNGGRQILKVHLPGDILGSPSMGLESAAETLTALTPVVTSRVRMSRFKQIFEEAPRIAALLFLEMQRERVALMDMMTMMGRAPAPTRMAAMLLDIQERLGAVQGTMPDVFELPLTQEQLGDLLGLTSVHVNRTLRALEQEGLVRRTRQQFELLDREALERFAERPRRTRAAMLDWLPAAR
jgi:CRP/FNR family transcriptional regulator, anaerobic regulatory protein